MLSLLLSCTANAFYNVAPGDETAHALKVTAYTIGHLFAVNVATGDSGGHDTLNEFVSEDYRDWENYPNIIGYIYRAYVKNYYGLEQGTAVGLEYFRKRLYHAIDNNSKSLVLVDTVEVYEDEDGYPLPIYGIKVDANFDIPLDTKSKPTGLIPDNQEEGYIERQSYLRTTLPDSWDLSAEYSECFRVKNQSSCASCYAFGAVGAIESQVCIQHMKTYGEPWMPEISEQQLMNCTEPEKLSVSGVVSDDDLNWFGGFGCYGGSDNQINKLAWIAPNWNGSFCKKDPNNLYGKSNNSACNIDCEVEEGLYLDKGDSEFPPYYAISSADDAKHLLSEGKVLTARVIQVPEMEFMSGGVFTDSNGDCYSDKYPGVDHLVVIVGWGVEHGVSFWRVKNSYGTDFGESGYYKIKMTDNGVDFGADNLGVCGIQSLMKVFAAELNAPNGSLNTTTTTTTNWAPIQREANKCVDKSERCSSLINAVDGHSLQCTQPLVDDVELVYYSQLCPATCARVSEYVGGTCEEFECKHYNCEKDYHLRPEEAEDGSDIDSKGDAISTESSGASSITSSAVLLYAISYLFGLL